MQVATTSAESAQCAAAARAKAAKASGVGDLDDFAFEEIRSASGVDEVLDTVKACLETGSNVSDCGLQEAHDKAVGVVSSDSRREGATREFCLVVRDDIIPLRQSLN